MLRSAHELQADIATLEEFADAYRHYFGADSRGEGPHESIGNRAALRQAVLRKVGPVEAIMSRTGTNRIGVFPPPAVGAPGVQGVSSLIFADEQTLYPRGAPPAHQMVLDAIEQTIGLLQHELRRRGRPSPSKPALQGWPPRFPRLILDRMLRHVPRWAATGERIVLFTAAVAAIASVLGASLGWWSNPTP